MKYEADEWNPLGPDSAPAVTGCNACENPLSGLYRAGCRGCSLRLLASGQPFFQSMRQQRLTPEYRVALRRLGDEEAVHKDVKAVAKTIYTGARG